MYTKKIQVSPGIFHGIPLESNRRCSTCRNGQITEDVQKISYDFPRGYQTFLPIASSKQEEDWENSPNPLSVKMGLCKHGKSALLLLYNNS